MEIIVSPARNGFQSMPQLRSQTCQGLLKPLWFLSFRWEATAIHPILSMTTD